MHPDIAFLVQQEQRKDLLREIEKEHLIRSVAGRQTPEVWGRLLAQLSWPKLMQKW